MTHAQWFQCFFACLIGNLIALIFKIRSLVKDHKNENMTFSLRQFLRDDKWAIIGDLAGSFTMVYVADEWLGAFGNYFIDKVKTLFVFVGMGGSFVITHLFGAAKDKFRERVKQARESK